MYINLINFDVDSSFLVDLPLEWLNWNVHDSIESTEIFNISDIL